MQPLLIVGHPNSGYQLVEKVLQTYGMREAKPSRSQLLTPTKIATKLLKTDKITFLDSTNIHQIETSAIWNELALDLFLGNLEQDFWGWSDPQSIYMLDYWKSVEPKLKYILVYTSPEIAHASILKNKTVTEEKLQQVVDQWENYNKELVSFYLNNTKNCLLVHVDRVKEDILQFIDLVSNLLNLSLEEIGVNQESGKALSEENIEPNAADLVLARQLIQPLSNVQDSYEELQSVANMPFEDESNHIIDPMIAWNSLYEEHTNDEKIIEAQQYKELKQENELLLLQLHQIQEELEQYYLENQKIKHGGSLINHSSGANTPYYGAGDRIKRQLSYRLGATMIEKSRNLSGWISMPWALLRTSKQFKIDRAQWEKEKLPPVSQYQDAYEAESIKRHLSYRLGSAMIANTKSPIGWIKLPFALRHEIKDFNRQRAGR